MMISVIIPTLNEARVIGSTLAHLATANGQFQIIVVDGGSTDATAEICRGFPEVHFIQMTSAQRAQQMNCGADAAMGNWTKALLGIGGLASLVVAKLGVDKVKASEPGKLI